MNMIKKIRERLTAIAAEIRGINDAVEARGALTLEDTEQSQYDALVEERTALSARLAQLEAEEASREALAGAMQANGTADAPASGVATIGHEPQMYERGNGRSYFQDLAKATVRNDQAAHARLTRHAVEMDVEMPRRIDARAKRAQANLETLGNVKGANPDGSTLFEKRVNPNRTDGQGGYFVPPLWLVDDYVHLVRAGRVGLNLARHFDLPEGTDSINLPKVATGTATAVQTADAGAVQSTDLTDTSVVAPVRTIAGQQDVAMQLLDQSPVNFDDIILTDLLADYNQKADLQYLYGSGSSGQVKGLNNVSGINAVTYTDATPTVPELYLPAAQALSLVARLRLMPATAVLCTSLRWYWMMSALDSNNRPLVVPSGPAFNPIGSSDGATAEGVSGNVLGVNWYADNNIAVNLGAGTNQDEIFAAKFDDTYVWEGSPKTRVLTEVLSGTLQVRFQLYNYIAVMADRYPAAISTINGTGLIVPAGF